ncbi:phytanoyl-CoA dioxygenase [Corallococcus sp. AB049A]|uniref:Phytanoyl-CoA dioxygenase n=1 Tax=Corallococcus interemptor TaxID=2316720 RepID=A0A3A8QD30_9BACT|nr:MULTISPECIES: phytanoyl-CoA dioxygenase family protein [Corallococcus]RKH47538.1 phytanoyl-CoA dioxygenase [Corallococcus sp. AB050B]RKH64880.1 phytanoyl-CoA dioxygenase [Corallococcus interemptor]RKI54192.1 phytanoyl-CoA dioxygenase [Corallococcus sp. AB049A]
MSTVHAPQETHEPADLLRGLYGDGIIGLKGAFPRDWAVRMREDIETLFAEARQVPGGALPRGPQRWYVEVHPERIRGFVDIATHPWFVAVCEAVLGPGYRIVEVGFDVPFPGAADQPWHRDFAAPEATTKGRRLNSLAFNLTAVDTIPEMGPFEVAPGTQWDQFEGCPKGMFPPRELWPRYIARAVPKLPRMGDLSARSALTIHRGTANRSDQSRPVLVVGVDAPDATNANHHDLQVTRRYLESLPPRVREHLTYRVVDTLQTVVQHHTIEGLLKPAY